MPQLTPLVQAAETLSPEAEGAETLSGLAEGAETLSPLSPLEALRYALYPGLTTYPGSTTYPGDYTRGVFVDPLVEGSLQLTPEN